MKRISFSALFTQGILRVAEGKGARVSSLLKSAHIPESRAFGNHERFSLEEVCRIYHAAIDSTLDEAIGLHVGEAITPRSLSALGYALMSCSNLRSAAQLNRRFSSLVADFGRVEIAKSHGQVLKTIRTENLDHDLIRPINETFIAAWWTYSKWILGREPELNGVYFSHQRPEYTEEYTRIFGIKPTFNRLVSGLIFNDKYLDYPLKNSDIELHMEMKKMTRKLMSKPCSSFDIKEEVERQIRSLLPKRRATLCVISQNLGMSERAIRKMLNDRGYRFQNLLLQIRYSLAREYLILSNIPISDISHNLGYRDQSAFTNAFKSWAGINPREYRKAGVSKSSESKT